MGAYEGAGVGADVHARVGMGGNVKLSFTSAKVGLVGVDDANDQLPERPPLSRLDRTVKGSAL